GGVAPDQPEDGRPARGGTPVRGPAECTAARVPGLPPVAAREPHGGAATRPADRRGDGPGVDPPDPAGRVGVPRRRGWSAPLRAGRCVMTRSYATSSVPHGMPNRYTAGCRCRTCRDGWAEAARA